MSLCVVCVQSVSDAGSLCPYHVTPETDWAVANRIMCDFVHRAIVPRRLAPADREAVEVEA